MAGRTRDGGRTLSYQGAAIEMGPELLAGNGQAQVAGAQPPDHRGEAAVAAPESQPGLLGLPGVVPGFGASGPHWEEDVEMEDAVREEEGMAGFDPLWEEEASFRARQEAAYREGVPHASHSEDEGLEDMDLEGLEALQ